MRKFLISLGRGGKGKTSQVTCLKKKKNPESVSGCFFREINKKDFF